MVESWLEASGKEERDEPRMSSSTWFPPDRHAQTQLDQNHAALSVELASLRELRSLLAGRVRVRTERGDRAVHGQSDSSAISSPLWSTRWLTCVLSPSRQDEIFHIPQAQQYCRGYFLEWDPKLTTPPGLCDQCPLFRIRARDCPCN